MVPLGQTLSPCLGSEPDDGGDLEESPPSQHSRCLSNEDSPTDSSGMKQHAFLKNLVIIGIKTFFIDSFNKACLFK